MADKVRDIAERLLYFLYHLADSVLTRIDRHLDKRHLEKPRPRILCTWNGRGWETKNVPGLLSLEAPTRIQMTRSVARWVPDAVLVFEAKTQSK